MKKIQLSRMLMIATILLLAVFEGYWLDKLYRDEYRNLKKEVDVNFRDAMYKLQRQRFETDTNLVHHIVPANLRTVARKSIPAGKKDSIKKGQVFVYKSMPSADVLKEMGKDRIQTVNIRGYGSLGVPPPGLIEMIVKQRAGQPDSNRMVIRMDSGFAMPPDVKERLRSMGFPSVSSVRIQRKDSAQVVSWKDSLTQIPGGVTFSLEGSSHPEPQQVKTVRALAETATGFNNVVISVNEKQGKEPSPFVRFLATNKTINDSIPVRVVDSAYRAELAKSNKKLPYTILFKKYTDTVARKADFEPDSSANVITSKFFVGYNTPYSYQAAFSDAGPFVMKKMGMQIGGSALLLLFVLISFITVYRNLLAQQRLTTIKNDFISNITHELKTPIATVNVAIEALRNFGGLQSPERTKEYLDISASELQRLGLLVDKVLKLSMFENHEIALQKESFDLLHLVEEVMASMKLQFEKQKTKVILESSGSNFMIDADRLHITSVVYNLLDNALKYSKEDPRINIRLAREEKYFELRVSDNGIGIPDAYRARIFDQFFRVPSGNRHDTKGYGLGLSYVNHIVQQHHGSIQVESELGKGSTFIVKMPFAEADNVQFNRGAGKKKSGT